MSFTVGLVCVALGLGLAAVWQLGLQPYDEPVPFRPIDMGGLGDTFGPSSATTEQKWLTSSFVIATCPPVLGGSSSPPTSLSRGVSDSEMGKPCADGGAGRRTMILGLEVAIVTLAGLALVLRGAWPCAGIRRQLVGLASRKGEVRRPDAIR